MKRMPHPVILFPMDVWKGNCGGPFSFSLPLLPLNPCCLFLFQAAATTCRHVLLGSGRPTLACMNRELTRFGTYLLGPIKKRTKFSEMNLFMLINESSLELRFFLPSVFGPFSAGNVVGRPPLNCSPSLHFLSLNSSLSQNSGNCGKLRKE